jgi:hypothetical protein
LRTLAALAVTTCMLTPEPLAEHAARVPDPAAVVDREPDWDRMMI